MRKAGLVESDLARNAGVYKGAAWGRRARTDETIGLTN